MDDGFIGSDLGSDLLGNASSYPLMKISAVSFSGGEALLEKERLYRWLADLQQVPGIDHIWIYTNGLLLTEEVLDHLAALGLDEIRFNAAATAYQHPHVLNMIRQATKTFAWVTVEIPLQFDHREILLNSLPVWVDHGVRLLNIHELLYEPGSNAESLPGERQHLRLPDGHKTAVDPRSSDLALEVFQEVKSKNLSLSVNYCSTVGKWRQLTARREALLSKSAEHCEDYRGDGILESCYMQKGSQIVPLHPSELEQLQQENPRESFYRLRRMAPLSLKDSHKHWLSFETLDPKP
jgi:pyruvate formate-lyase activating enzyme-like uncharacterized protein